MSAADKARKQVAHAAYLRACANGQKPQRATMFADRRKKNNKEACRDKQSWDKA